MRTSREPESTETGASSEIVPKAEAHPPAPESDGLRVNEAFLRPALESVTDVRVNRDLFHAPPPPEPPEPIVIRPSRKPLLLAVALAVLLGAAAAVLRTVLG